MTPQVPGMTGWRKSSYSNGLGGECVELAALPGQILIRDSKDPHGPVISLPIQEGHALMAWIREVT
jgi:hypothetical protein